MTGGSDRGPEATAVTDDINNMHFTALLSAFTILLFAQIAEPLSGKGRSTLSSKQ